MRFLDILRLSFQSLWQQKVRALLTLIGVITGTFLIVLSLSIGEGVKIAVLQKFSKGERLRTIEVMPGRGSAEDRVPAEKLKLFKSMSEAKRERIRKAIIDRWKWRTNRPKVPLTMERLREISALDHVELVVPEIFAAGDARFGKKTVEDVHMLGVAKNNSLLKKMLVAGRMFSQDDSHALLIHEYLAYRWGFISDRDVDQLIGKTVRLEFQPSGRALADVLRYRSGSDRRLTASEARILDRIFKKLPHAVERLNLSTAERAVLRKAFTQRAKKPKTKPQSFSMKFTVAGIFRDAEKEEKRGTFRSYRLSGLDVAVPFQTAQAIALQIPKQASNGFPRATVTVDHIDHVKAVADKIDAMELRQFSLISVVERIQQHVLLITSAMALLAGMALFVAGLGIANTMVMSVLERTHEIGVMKAVGAQNRHILLIFLIEGTMIGFLGGLVGTVLAWAASFPGDALIKNALKDEFRTPFEESLF
ncbi:MAG: ABC transporter permease, partial [Planctomycetes bacterium]|nr:ABC transporter permease [Planctomycetota bacterium]